MPYVDNQMSLPSEGTLDQWQRPMVSFQEGQYNMDLNTLLFIVGQGKTRVSQAPKRPPNAPLGPCYNYEGDHLIKD